MTWRVVTAGGGAVIECVRAVLLTPAGRLLLIRRTWPGATPYRVFPGGHVEPGDPSLRAALAREIREETGAEPQIMGLLQVLADEYQRQYFYLACIGSWSEADRTGPEFGDPDRGEYQLEEVPLTVQALDAVSPDPEEITALLREAVRAGTDLAALADPAR
ncbi:NUDIX domain-containing protein [Streptomyces sp. NPDC059837]|uniref:NUDIX domain-containing protein n=1 Tax=Streptomyces sp. NPDC059837 TaxID=3346968 RepID=UPI0036638D90